MCRQCYFLKFQFEFWILNLNIGVRTPVRGGRPPVRGGRTPIFYSGKNIHKEWIKGLYSNVMRWSSNIVKKNYMYLPSLCMKKCVSYRLSPKSQQVSASQKIWFIHSKQKKIPLWMYESEFWLSSCWMKLEKKTIHVGTQF